MILLKATAWDHSTKHRPSAIHAKIHEAADHGRLEVLDDVFQSS